MNDENIHIGKLLKQCLMYWKIYVPIGIVCLIAGILFICITPKEYEFKARMQLISEKQNIMSEMKMLKSSGIGALLGGSSSGISIEDEVIVITSRTNMTEAIRQTNYQLEMRQRRGFKNVLLYGKEQPVTLLFPEQCLDTLSKSIKINLSLSGGKIQSAKIKSDLFETVKIKDQSLPCRLQLPIGTLFIAANVDAPNSGEQQITCQINPLQKTYEDLDYELYVGAQETVSDVILLTFDNENKERGHNFLNTLMNVYNQYSRNVTVKEANLNSKFVKERLDSVTTELAYLEHQIETYKKQNNIPEPILYAKAAVEGRQELETIILETEVRLNMLDYVVEYMRNPQNDYTSIPAVEGIGEKSVAIYNQLVLDRQRLLLSSEKGNPALTLANNQLAEQRKMLVEAIDAARKSIRASLETINKKNHTLNNMLSALPKQEREYIEMKRQQKIKETVYLFLMQKLQEKELANSPDEQAGRVVDTAYCSAKAVYPKKLIIMIVALIAACIFSLIVISLRMNVSHKK